MCVLHWVFAYVCISLEREIFETVLLFVVLANFNIMENPPAST